MSQYNPDTGVVFEQVMFQGDLIHVSWTEAHERGEGAVMVRTLVINGPKEVPLQYEEFMDALQELIDEGQRILPGRQDEQQRMLHRDRPVR